MDIFFFFPLSDVWHCLAGVFHRKVVRGRSAQRSMRRSWVGFWRDASYGNQLNAWVYSLLGGFVANLWRLLVLDVRCKSSPQLELVSSCGKTSSAWLWSSTIRETQQTWLSRQVLEQSLESQTGTGVPRQHLGLKPWKFQVKSWLDSHYWKV